MLNSGDVYQGQRLDKIRRDLATLVGPMYANRVDQVMPMAQQMINDGHAFQDVIQHWSAQIMGNGPQAQAPQSNMRDLPVNPRVGKKDKWGALAAQQDEAQRKQDEERRIIEQQKRNWYREELDRQAESARQMRTQERQQGRVVDEDMISNQVNNESNKQNQGAAEIGLRYKMRKDFDDENIRNKIVREHNTLQQRRAEDDRYVKEMTDGQRTEEQRRNAQEEFLKKMQHETVTFNQNQIALKRKQFAQDRSYEKANYNRTSIETNDLYEQRRQKFLRDFQNYHAQVTGSHEIVSGFQRYNNASHEAGRQDEARQMQEQARQESAFQQKEEEQRQKREAAKQEMINALNDQVKARNQRAVDEVAQDRKYGSNVIRQVKQESQREEEAARARREAMASYSTDLVGQIHSTARLRKKEFTMTDHEKRVNAGELENFKSGQPVTNAKLPGFSQNLPLGFLNQQRSHSPYTFEKPMKRTELMKQQPQRSRSTTPFKKFTEAHGLPSLDYYGSQVPVTAQPPNLSTFSRNAARILS